MTMTEQVTRVIEAYGSERIGQFVWLGELAAKAELSEEQMAETIAEMRKIMDLRLDASPFAHNAREGNVRVWNAGEWMNTLALD